jgi:S2P endopeptidase
MSTIALSLFLINLLPLPHTDGSSLLRSLLHLYRSRNHHSSSPPTNTKPLQATLSNGTPSLGLSKPAPSINLSRQYELNSDDEDEYGEEGRGRGRGGGAGGGGGGGGGGGVGEGKKEEAWKRRIRRGVEAGMVGLVLAWAAGWGMLALLRSS